MLAPIAHCYPTGPTKPAICGAPPYERPVAVEYEDLPQQVTPCRVCDAERNLPPRVVAALAANRAATYQD